MSNKRGVSKIISSILLIALLVAVYFTFFFSYTCEDLSCFQAHQEKCSKTKFIRESESITWSYKIKGDDGGLCGIDAEILQVKKGDIDKIRLEGKSMMCYLPLGSTSLPELDLSRCNGILKEELQNIIIKNLHTYIVENIGEITEELNKPI